MERLRELLEAAPELVQALSDDGFSPLHFACFSGGAETTRLLAEQGAPLERLAENSFARVRPLGTAAFARELESARVLLECGADADGPGEGGFAPLHTAAQNGDIELVRLLLAHGADPLRPAATTGRLHSTSLETAATKGASGCSRRQRPAHRPSAVGAGTSC